MSMEQLVRVQWFVRRDGRIRGPLAAREISRQIVLGRIDPSDELSDDRAYWRPLAALPQLIPDIARQAHTEAGRSRLVLARLREDERVHERRVLHSPGRAAERRHGDRRNYSSLETFAIPEAPDIEAETAANESRLLLPLAGLMVLLFALGFYLIR